MVKLQLDYKTLVFGLRPNALILTHKFSKTGKYIKLAIFKIKLTNHWLNTVERKADKFAEGPYKIKGGLCSV